MVKYSIAIAGMLSLLSACKPPQKSASSLDFDPYHYTVNKKLEAENGAVVSAHPLASKAGVSILKSGGNAVDGRSISQCR